MFVLHSFLACAGLQNNSNVDERMHHILMSQKDSSGVFFRCFIVARSAFRFCELPNKGQCHFSPKTHCYIGIWFRKQNFVPGPSPMPQMPQLSQDFSEIFRKRMEGRGGGVSSASYALKKRCSGKIVGLTCCAILSNLLYVYDIHVHILFNTYYIHGIHRFKIWHRSSITTFHSFNLHCMRLHSKVQDMLYAWNSYIEHTPCG